MATGRSAGGYTLIELLVVLAILVALTAAFPLAYGYLSPTHRVQVEAEQVATDLRFTRGEAIRTRRIATFDVDTDSPSYQAAGQRIHDFPGGLSIELASGVAAPRTTTKIRFFPDGSADGVELHLTSAKRDARIRVSALTGRVIVQ